MAKNHVQGGSVLTLIAPAGGVVSGELFAVGTLAVVAHADAAEGQPVECHADGVWRVPAAAGLTVGAAVGLLAGEVVAAATAEAVACGKLVTASAGGYADLRLSN